MCGPNPVDGCIVSNSDIAGIGVRIAIYTQNLLSFVPAIYALLDNRVSKVELESLETQSTGILMTALAILLSVAIQPSTGAPVSNFHTAIVLNLSWMNNTNAFIYFILRVYHELGNSWGELTKDSKLGIVPSFKDLRVWIKIVKNAALNRTGIFGSLHLSLMAAIGIWLWQDPKDFQNSPCCAIQASLFVVGHKVSFGSRGLQVWSLMTYSAVLIPVLNFILPTLLFLAPFLTIYKSRPSHPGISAYINAVRVGLAMLFLVNAILLADIEVTLAKNTAPFLEQDPTQWTFGQTLALLVLAVPLRDIYETIQHRRPDELGKELLRMLCDQGELDDAAIRLIDQGANATLIDKSGNSVLTFAILNGKFKIVEALAKHGTTIKDVKLEGGGLIFSAVKEGHLDIAEYLLNFLTKYDYNANLQYQYNQILFHQVVSEGHLKIISFLTEHGFDSNWPDQNNLTPLYQATVHGHLDVVRYLAEHGADVNFADNDNQTPIFLAISKGHLEITRYLAERGADINFPNMMNQTPIALATRQGQLEVVRFLTEHGANINFPNNHMQTPLAWATELAHVEIVKYLTEHGADVNVSDEDNWTPLAVAASKHLEITMYLTEHGADVNFPDNDNWTPLFWAVFQEHLGIVRYLTEHGANVNFQDVANRTPLHWAASRGHLDIVQNLLEHGANINFPDIAHRVPLHWATLKGRLVVVKYLTEHGADINFRDDNKQTPLYWAIEQGHLELVIYLIEYGADVNIPDQDNWTPLSLAASRGRLDIVRYLVEHGANVNFPNDDNWTPLYLATLHGHLEIVMYLAESGADVNFPDDDKRTPLSRAIERGHQEVIKYLTEHGAK